MANLRILRKEFADTHSRVAINKAEISKAAETISNADLSEDTKSRVLGAIRTLYNPRPQEILEELSKEGRIRGLWRKVYGKLRHPSVHGKTVDGDLQGSVDLCEAGLTMFYELVFARIGYAGPYSDYSRREAPTIDFPPTGHRAADDTMHGNESHPGA